MTRKEQNDRFNELVKKSEEILLKKGSDYSNEDALSNFKQVSLITQVPVETVALVLIGIKVARLGNLFNKDSNPSNESVYDSVIDLLNYSILLDAILFEKNKQEIKQPNEN